jgi:hypothetical protein
MIFAHTLGMILDGSKRQTRRLIKTNEDLADIVPLRVMAGSRTVYQVGKTYAVQPNRGKKSVARILLTNIRREAIAQIDEHDARAEGFANREAFIQTWQAIHGKKAPLDAVVWVLDFELCEIIEDEWEKFCGEQYTENKSLNHRQDLSRPIQEISRGRLYGGHYRSGGVG